MALALTKHIAANVGALRQSRRLTQASLAKLAGLPRSTVTLLESGSANPSISSLAAVASALQVSLDELLAKPRASCQFYPASEIPLHRRSKEGVRLKKLLPDPIPAMEMDELTLAPGVTLTGAPHIRGTKEYFYCHRGEIEVEVGGERFTVKEGDLIAFPGDQAHSYRNVGRKASAGLSVVVWAPEGARA